MKVDIFGAVFLDRYTYEDHDSTEVVESIGGSGLNIALGLHLLGHEVKFYGNIGSDKRKIKLLNELKVYDFPIADISIKSGMTGLFNAKNDKLTSVERGVNAEPLIIDSNSLRGECAVLTTELNKSSIQKILSYIWKQIFIDVGPRPHILEDISLSDNIIKIGNTTENEIMPCHVKKLGPNGAKWGNIVIDGNNDLLPYTIGAGDLFDTILIDGMISGRDKGKVLKLAVELAEKSCRIKGGFKIRNVINEYRKLVGALSI